MTCTIKFWRDMDGGTTYGKGGPKFVVTDGPGGPFLRGNQKFRDSSCPCKVSSRVSDALSQALCNLSLAFLADFTLSDSTALIRFIVKLFSLASYTLLFVWIERQDHSVHMSCVLQVQHLYTAGIPLLEAYLLPMANNHGVR